MLTCESCGAPADHAEHYYDKVRAWCELHTPWSGHYEFCGKPCQDLLANTRTDAIARLFALLAESGMTATLDGEPVTEEQLRSRVTVIPINQGANKMNLSSEEYQALVRLAERAFLADPVRSEGDIRVLDPALATRVAHDHRVGRLRENHAALEPPISPA